MCASLPIPAVFVAALLCLSCTIQAQISRVLSGCETPPAAQKILDEQLGRKRLDEMKFPERIAFERQVRQFTKKCYVPKIILPQS
jgi:hypothetical protein